MAVPASPCNPVLARTVWLWGGPSLIQEGRGAGKLWIQMGSRKAGSVTLCGEQRAWGGEVGGNPDLRRRLPTQLVLAQWGPVQRTKPGLPCPARPWPPSGGGNGPPAMGAAPPRGWPRRPQHRLLTRGLAAPGPRPLPSVLQPMPALSFLRP